MNKTSPPTMDVLLVGGAADGREFTVPSGTWDIRVQVPGVDGTLIYQRAVPLDVFIGAVVFTLDGKPGTESLEQTVTLPNHLWQIDPVATTQAKAKLQKGWNRLAAPFALAGPPTEHVAQDDARANVLVSLSARGLRRRS